MGTWSCKPRTPQATAAGVWSRAQVLNSCADVRLLIPARTHVHARTHETDQTIRGTRAARRCARACVRVERLTSRAISFRPLRALTPVHGREWHGLACGMCDAFQHTSPARSEPRRVRCVLRGPVQRWRWRAAGQVVSRRGRPAAKGWGSATHSRGLDADGTACFRSVHPAAAAAVRAELGRSSLRRVDHVSLTPGR